MLKTQKQESLRVALRQFWYLLLIVLGLLAFLLFIIEADMSQVTEYWTEGIILGLTPIFVWLIVKPIRNIAVQECNLSASIIDSATDGILLVNHHGKIQLINPAAEAIFGFSAAQVVGKHISKLTPPPDQKANNQFVQSYLRVKSATQNGKETEVIAVRKGSETIFVDLSLSRMITDGKSSYVAIVRDITLRIHTEELARDRLAKAKHLEGIQQVAVTLQHEINNPLTAVLGIAQLIEMKIPDIEENPTLDKLENLKSAATYIVELTRRIGGVVQKLKDLDKPVLTTHPMNDGFDVQMIDLRISESFVDSELCHV